MSLLTSISASPGDLSGTSQSTDLNGGNAIGNCGSSDLGPVGYFETIVKTFGVPGPGECVIRPNVDYYMNVESIYDVMPVRDRWAADIYGVVIGVLP
jgi:hypothetical protein